jgi:hypothetical protein
MRSVGGPIPTFAAPSRHPSGQMSESKGPPATF